MRKLFVFIVAAIFILSMVVFSLASGPGRKVVWDNKAAGKVTFDGTAHANIKCAACHPGLYKMKAPFDKITMADLNAGKSCGTANCHDGKKAFGVKDCRKCHVKS